MQHDAPFVVVLVTGLIELDRAMWFSHTAEARRYPRVHAHRIRRCWLTGLRNRLTLSGRAGLYRCRSTACWVSSRVVKARRGIDFHRQAHSVVLTFGCSSNIRDARKPLRQQTWLTGPPLCPESCRPDVLQRLYPRPAVRGWSGRVRPPAAGLAGRLDRATGQDQRAFQCGGAPLRGRPCRALG